MWRRAIEDAAARVIQRILVRDLDPITLQPIKTRILIGEARVCRDAHSLYDYVSYTGDARDPVTRQPLGKHDLDRLARACKRQPLDARALAQQFQEETARRQLVEHLRDELARAMEIGNFSLSWEILYGLREVDDDRQALTAFAGQLRRRDDA